MAAMNTGAKLPYPLFFGSPKDKPKKKKKNQKKEKRKKGNREWHSKLFLIIDR
jgi:hypothetical protein